MSQKLLIVSIIVVLVIIAGVGYFALVQKPTTPDTNTVPTDENGTSQLSPIQPPTPDTVGGAGGSGLPDKPPASKMCEDRDPPAEQVFGAVLNISPDGQKILLESGGEIKIGDLPSEVKVSAESTFSVTNAKFTSAVLSPTESLVAYAVDGGTHEWGGITNLNSGLSYPVTFSFDGSISNPKWNHDGKYVVFANTSPKPQERLMLVNATAMKTYTTDYETEIDFEDINPLPSTVLLNQRGHYWSSDKDNKIYFLVATKGTIVGVDDDVEHAELWSVNADTLKWDFYCTSY